MNILNPALTARAFLYFSYPVQISGDDVWIVHKASEVVDGSVARPRLLLPLLRNMVPRRPRLWVILPTWPSIWKTMFMGTIPGSIGETSALACLIGAVILIACGVGSWRIMVSVIGGAALTAVVLNLLAGESLPGMLSLTPAEHLVMGGLMFGAIFMATDPVSAARTAKGMYLYGLLIGILTVLIRIWNPAYPEGVMLAILFMNIFAPLIDHYVVKGNIKRRLQRGS